MSDADFRDNEIYGFDATAPGAPDGFATSYFLKAIGADPSSDAAYEKLRTHFAWHRLRDLAAMQELDGRRAAGMIELFHLASIPVRRPDSAIETHHHVAERIDSRSLMRMDARWIELQVGGAELSQWPLVAFGVLGFILLWRRGGDSPTARWLALWLLGGVAVATGAFADFLLPGVKWDLWLSAASSPFGAFALRVSGLLELATIVLILLGRSGLPLWALWAHLCWPTPYRSGGDERRRLAVAAGKIAVVTASALGVTFLAGCACRLAGMVLDPDESYVFAVRLLPFVAFVVINALMFGVGARMRRRSADKSEVPRLGWLPIAAFVAGELTGLTILFADFDAGGDPIPWVAIWTARAFAALFFVLAVGAILRRDFLRIAAGKDLSFVILAGFLPVFLQIGEDVTKHVVEHSPLVSEAGGRILGVVLVAAFLGPLEHLLERIVLHVSVRRLRHVEHGVGEAVELLTGSAPPENASHAIAEVFGKLRVPAYLFYVRSGPCEFRLLASRGRATPPATITLSPHALTAFGHERRFVDLVNAAFEWRHFFHQFELYRIERSTGARFVMPFCLRTSVCGLLLLPESAEAGEISRDAVAEEINDLGVAVTRSRG